MTSFMRKPSLCQCHRDIELTRAPARTGGIRESNAWAPAKFSLCRASRTDRGVHACINVMTLKLLVDASSLTPSGALPVSILEVWNAALSTDVRILGAQKAEGAVRARTACSLRTYEYLIPIRALKGVPPKELERVMRWFEGNHRLRAPIPAGDVAIPFPVNFASMTSFA